MTHKRGNRFARLTREFDSTAGAYRAVIRAAEAAAWSLEKALLTGRREEERTLALAEAEVARAALHALARRTVRPPVGQRALAL